MIRQPNPELTTLVLDALAEKYKLNERREGIHLSTLNYCLTKGYLDYTSPIPPTEIELLLFSTGYGLEEVMTHSIAEHNVYEKDGIIYRPDNLIPVTDQYGVNGLVEMKSTRAGKKRYQEGNLPDTWISYMKGGCYMMNTNTYNLCVIHVSDRPAAAIASEVITFGDNELIDNWSWLTLRRDVYQEALDAKTVPIPRMWCESWLCNNCRYSIICDSILLLKEKEDN